MTLFHGAARHGPWPLEGRRGRSGAAAGGAPPPEGRRSERA